MASLIIVSSTTLTKPSFLPSFSGRAAGLCFRPSGAQVLNCRRCNDVEKKLVVPMISQRDLLIRQRNTRFVALSRKGSDGYLGNAAVEPFEFDTSKGLWEALQGHLDVFYRFSRIMVFMGLALSIVSASLLSLEKLSDFSPLFLTGMFEAIAATFFSHIYLNGLNQLTDVDIDKVNKPYLPLASGEYSIKTGLIITSSCAIMGLLLGWVVGSYPLVFALLLRLVFGAVYSINVPYLRWKNNAFLAAVCIFALLVPTHLAYYSHMQTFVFGRPALFSKRVIFSAVFITLFSVVSSLAKDIPDVAGDKLHGVQSFAVQWGAEKVFGICNGLLQIGYIVAILVGLTCSQNWSKIITVGGHMLLSLMLWRRAKSVDLENQASTTSFYQFIWQLFYAECFLMPLIR